MTCPDCLKASASVLWGGYRKDCLQCEIRSLAQAPRHIREAKYSQIERSGGRAAVVEVMRSVKEEHARIQARKGGQVNK